MCFLEWMGHQWTKAIVLFSQKQYWLSPVRVTTMQWSPVRVTLRREYGFLEDETPLLLVHPPDGWYINIMIIIMIVIMIIICLSTHTWWLMNIMIIFIIIICLSSHLVSWCHHDHVDKHYWNYYHQDHQKLTTSPNPSKLSPLLHHSTLAAGIACHRNHDHLVIIINMMVIIFMIILLIIPLQNKQVPS